MTPVATERLRYLARLNPEVPAGVRSDPARDLPYLPMEALGEDWSLRFDQNRPVSAVLAGNSYFENGDILFAKVTPCFENGKAALVSGVPGGSAFGTTEVTVVRPSPQVESKFLFYVLVAADFQQRGRAEMTGAGGLRRVPDRAVRNYRVPLHPRDRQKAIVDYLDRETAEIDAFIADQEKLIELLTERRAATITRTITRGLDHAVKLTPSGVHWLGDVPASWQVLRIKHVATSRIGLTYEPADLVEDSDPNATLVLRAGNIQQGRISISKDVVYVRKSIPAQIRTRAGDILICVRSGSRSLIGKSALITESESGQTFGAFMSTLRATDPEYMSHVLNSSLMSSQIGLFATSTVNQLTKATLDNFDIPWPPAKERTAITDYLRDALAEINATVFDAREAIALSKERRAALISAAVTGKIDVREHGKLNA